MVSYGFYLMKRTGLLYLEGNAEWKIPLSKFGGAAQSLGAGAILVHIAQRGVVGPLIMMLRCPEAQPKEMSAFALGRPFLSHLPAQDTGGIVPLLKLLDSKNGTLQHNAAFALYGPADYEVTSNLLKVRAI
ncbi:hypothetical protein L2E82_27985 [Cichorium intybus]|uniref:Uncharacterized protein n=1 Tax=Cichorium intybus TaxID=13427 RepID=A0ACB9CV60_CICIN|nr:hypothetical protein L2E82_27985 [Cichorium intybus]